MTLLNNTWVDVLSLEELPVNLGKTVRYREFEVAVFRLGNGTVRALQNRCPHKQGVLAEGMVCDDHVFCPMHDRKIHLPSGLVQAPDTGCVETYPVQLKDGRVYVAFPIAQTGELVS